MIVSCHSPFDSDLKKYYAKKQVLFQIQYFISAIHYVTLRHKFVDVDKVEPADRVDEGEDDEEVKHAP